MLETHTNNGSVKIAEDVLAVIAGTAALEVDGVNPITDANDAKSRKNMAKGVKITVHDNQVNVALNVTVRQGYNIAETILASQCKVKTAIENMTGLFVATVDVNVIGLTDSNN